MTEAELRFGFGKNWLGYNARKLNRLSVHRSLERLKSFLRMDNFRGKTFLDIGSGSGLQSYCAYLLRAEQIISFDYDINSVIATRQLWNAAGRPDNWKVYKASVLDAAFMRSLPDADIVYSWGVLHHTGDMWAALRNAAIPMYPDGVMYIALYATEAYVDPPPEYWLAVKRRYNKAWWPRRKWMEWQYAWNRVLWPAWQRGENPEDVIRNYATRGMDFWTDVRDWLGGYPMEFASLPETRDFGRRELGLSLMNITFGEGCTEYLLCDPAKNAHWAAIDAARGRLPIDGEIWHDRGASYCVNIFDQQHQADREGDMRRSRLMLYEDGIALGLAHSLHNDIADLGCGRFSHWGSGLRFSATDNTDPRENGRQYSYSPTF